MTWVGPPSGVEPSPFEVAFHGDLVEITCPRTGRGEAETNAWVHADRLSRLLQEALATQAQTIVVDLEGSAAASTSLLAVLIEAKGRARRAGSELFIRSSPSLRALAEICRLQNLLPEPVRPCRR